MIEDTIGLGYVIPPGGANCGKGPNTGINPSGVDPFNAETVGMAAVGNTPATDDYDPGEGDIATDVAAGYSDLLGKFEAVYGNPGMLTGGTARALTAAQKHSPMRSRPVEPELRSHHWRPLSHGSKRRTTRPGLRLQMLPPVRFTRPVLRSGWRSPS